MSYSKAVPIFALFLIFASCSEPIPTGTISPKDFERALKKVDGLQLIDVRTPGEFEKGYIQGASNLDFYGENFRSELEELDRRLPIAVYCSVGGRSGYALTMLDELGFERIYNLDGGVTNWQENGYRLVGDE